MSINCMDMYSLQSSLNPNQQLIATKTEEIDPSTTHMCRLCLKSFSGKFASINDAAVRNIYEIVFKFQLSFDESLPSVVCAECSFKVDDFYLFHEDVRTNQIHLENTFKSDTNVLLLVEVKREQGETIANDLETFVSTHSDDGISESKEPTKMTVIESEEAGAIETVTETVEQPSPTGAVQNEKDNRTKDGDRKIKDFFNGIVCSICSNTFETFPKLKAHSKKVHDQRASITCCEQKYFKKYQLIEHINSHIDSKHNYCELCKKNYSSKNILKLHNLQYHTSSEGLPYQCDKCYKRFCSKSFLATHLKKHIQVECSLCCRTMASVYSLKVHLQKMHGENPRERDATYVCDSCGRVFHQKQSLERHINLQHLGAKDNYRTQCPVCAKWVNNKHYLKVHIRNAHSGENLQVTCDVCQQVLANKRAYYTHKHKVHAERKLECEICGKLFKQPNNLKEHRATHLGQLLYTCTVCGYGTNYNGNLYKHMKNKHPDECPPTTSKRRSLPVSKNEK